MGPCIGHRKADEHPRVQRPRAGTGRLPRGLPGRLPGRRRGLPAVPCAWQVSVHAWGSAERGADVGLRAQGTRPRLLKTRKMDCGCMFSLCSVLIIYDCNLGRYAFLFSDALSDTVHIFPMCTMSCSTAKNGPASKLSFLAHIEVADTSTPVPQVERALFASYV